MNKIIILYLKIYYNIKNMGYLFDKEEIESLIPKNKVIIKFSLISSLIMIFFFFSKLFL